jgi:glycosyltransferase involved in cell wall biosynthesis
MSTPALRPSTNPYATMLTTSLAQMPGVCPQTFTWRRALLGRYQVFHMHWAEAHLRGANPLKKAVRQVFFLMLLLRLKLTRIPLVQTVHNVELPQGISRVDRALLLLTRRWTTLRIRLNDDTEMPAGRAYETILHGHYRDWFAEYERSAATPGRVAFVGSVRRYKAVPQLAEAFADTTDDKLSLRISGRPSSDELAAQLQAMADRDPRISLCLRTITDAELVEGVTSAALVVLPYPEMHNSGAALATLSVDRPILVPDNPVNRKLADEVGPGWVQLFAAPLAATDLQTALTAVADPPAAAPDLSQRDWPELAEQHRAAYRRARWLVGRRGD